MRIPAWLFIGLLAACPLIASDNPFPKAPSEVEEALRSRVTEFYLFPAAEVSQGRGAD